MSDHTFISNSLTGILVENAKSHHEKDGVKKLIDELTPAERKILTLMQSFIQIKK